jgi:hypothetical protein
VNLRNPRGLDPTLTDVIREALKQDRKVTIEDGEYGMALALDGVELVDGLAWESFDYPLHRGDFSDEKMELITNLLRAREARSNERRRQSLLTRDSVQSHTVAEGEDL